MSTKRNPGLAARQGTVAAALAARGAAPAEKPAETIKGISLRLPLSTWEQLAELSHQRQFARRAEKRIKGDADPDSIHGIILGAIDAYLKPKK